MLFFRLYSLRELDVYNKGEVLLASLFLIAEYLRNTNRVPNANEVCKDGNICISLGEYVKAKEHSEKAVAIAEKIGDGKTEAHGYKNLGIIFHFLGENAKAKECIEKAFVLERKYGNSEHESICHLLLSILMFEEGNISESKSNAFVCFNKAEVIRRLQVYDKFKISYFDRMFSKYRILSQFLCDADFPYEALYTEEFRRARAL